MSITQDDLVLQQEVTVRRRAARDVNQVLHTDHSSPTRETTHKFKTGGPVINNNFIRPKLL